MKKLMLLVLVGILAMTSCKKDPITPVDPNPPITNRIFNNINTSVTGVVLDRNNQAIEGALISFGQKTAMTDVNGVFKIDNATVKENRAFVTVSKDGYFHGSRTYFAYANQLSHVKIHLLEKTIQGTIGTSGGTVTTTEGVKLEFPADAVADANGNPYTGMVDVAVQYLDPTANDIGFIMPGDLRGVTADNVENGLTTYGMVAVELIGSGGEILNVADGKTVQLTMPVASGQASSAPAEIPLWHFDEAEGVWKEEGKATLQGSEYVGEVSHFSFWNCDINWDLVYINGTITLDGTALEGAGVSLSFTNSSGSFFAWDFTNASGVYSGQVPLNTTFTLNVYPPDFNCGSAVFTQEIGPFTADETVPTINIDGSTIPNNNITVTGMLETCDGNPVTNGYARIKIGSAEYYEYTTDGSIDFSLINCTGVTEVEVMVVDADAPTQSDPMLYTYSNSLDFGTIQACESLDEFITYEVNGMTTTLIQNIGIYDSLGTGTGYHNLYGSDNNQNYFSLGFVMDGIGTFDVLDGYIAGISNPNGGSVLDMTVTITEYSNVQGEKVGGTFTGTTDDGTGPVPITGSFKAIREF